MITVSTSKKASYHHGDLREALLTAGLAMLEEGVDPSALSLREAARRAGVSAMAPYRHFVDRDALLSAIATIGFRRLASALKGGETAVGGAGSAAFEAQGIAYVSFACDNPALFRLMFGSKAPTKTDALAEAASETFAILSQRVASLVPSPLAHDVVLASWGLVHGLSMLAVDGQLQRFDSSPVDLTARIIGLLLQNGMGDPSHAKKPPLSAGAKPSMTRRR